MKLLLLNLCNLTLAKSELLRRTFLTLINLERVDLALFTR